MTLRNRFEKKSNTCELQIGSSETDTNQQRTQTASSSDNQPVEFFGPRMPGDMISNIANMLPPEQRSAFAASSSRMRYLTITKLKNDLSSAASVTFEDLTSIIHCLRSLRYSINTLMPAVEMNNDTATLNLAQHIYLLSLLMYQTTLKSSLTFKTPKLETATTDIEGNVDIKYEPLSHLIVNECRTILDQINAITINKEGNASTHMPKLSDALRKLTSALSAENLDHWLSQVATSVGVFFACGLWQPPKQHPQEQMVLLLLRSYNDAICLKMNAQITHQHLPIRSLTM